MPAARRPRCWPPSELPASSRVGRHLEAALARGLSVDPPVPHDRWSWLRWGFPFIGAGLLVGIFIVYETYLEEALYGGFARAHNPLQWVLLAAAAVLVPMALLAVARIPLRTHLLKAVMLETAGVAAMLAAWVVFTTIVLSGAH